MRRRREARRPGAASTQGSDARKIGAATATALVVANMVGTGIFVTSGYLAKTLGDPWLLLSVWLIGGLFALCGATVYAELGAMMPRAGGEYVYLSRAFHPVVGFLSGWVSLWVGFSAPIAAAATACALYASAVLPLPSVRVAAAALVVASSSLHMTSVTWGARAQTWLTLLKCALLLVFVGAAFTFGEGSFTHFARIHEPAPGALAAALVYVAFSYSGWNAAAYIAGELSDPGRSLPRALLFGTLAVTVLYVALNVAFVYALPLDALGERPELVSETASSALFGPELGRVVAACVALLLVSSVSAMVMAGPRVYLAMAEDGLFFRSLSRRRPGGAPLRSVALQGALSVLLVLTASFEALITYVGFTLSAFSALTILAAVRLRRVAPHAQRPYRAQAWPLSALAYVLLSAYIVVFSIVERPVVALAGALTLLGGLAAYFLWKGPGGRASEAPLVAAPDERSSRTAYDVTRVRRTASARRHRRRWPPGTPPPRPGLRPRA